MTIIDDDFHVQQYLRENLKQQEVQLDLARRVLTWAEVHSLIQDREDLVKLTNELGIDWTRLKLLHTGSRYTGSNLTSVIRSEFSPSLATLNGQRVVVKRLVQRDRYPTSRGIHFISQEISDAVKNIRIEFEWQGPVQFISMPICTGLIPIKLSDGELVNAESLALGPVESAMIITVQAGRDLRQIEQLFIWFGFDYGIPSQVYDELGLFINKNMK